MHSLKNQFTHKKVLIVGLGLQGGGVGLVTFFSRLGAHVRVTDLKTEKQLEVSLKKISSLIVGLTLGRHDIKDFLWADIIFKGPSVPWDIPCLKKAIAKGIPVEMETSFFASYCPCPLIGITGTRGKSTTATMIYTVMKESGFSVFLAGNVPHVSTIALLDRLTIKDYVVLELSSWQLSGFHLRKISPHIAVITNFYPDHLNYYKNLEDYWHDKTALYEYQKKEDSLVIPRRIYQKINKRPLSKIIQTHSKDFKEKLKYLRGMHNYENASQALAVSRLLAIDQLKACKIISLIHPLEYRMEKIATISGIDIYNDSTSTTPIACQKAIDSLREKKITLILGGNSKNLPIEELVRDINRYVAQVVLLKGSFTDHIQPFIDKNKIIQSMPFDDINKAFHTAFSCTQKNGVILFSPGATSFSLFENEFHRGSIFTKIVKEYEKEKIQ